MPTYIYLSQFSNQGVPDRINVDEKGSPISIPISDEIVKESLENLPNGNKTVVDIHPDWVRKSDINILNNCEVVTTFVSEGAGYKNTLYYYVYDTENPPARFSDLDKIYILFPNASLPGKGGNLKQGDSMKLVYESEVEKINGKNFVKLDSANFIFPEGKSLGFACGANAWNLNGSSRAFVNTGKGMFSTDPVMNPERYSNLRHHAINYRSQVDETKIIYGFEDIRRDKRWCDHDFNDLIYCVTCTPFKSIIDGSYNSVKTQTYNGYIVCEDIAHKSGDHDFNDLMLQYHIVENLKDDLIFDINFYLTGLHRGAAYDHEFGVVIPNIKSIDGVKMFREIYRSSSKTSTLTNLTNGNKSDRVPLIPDTRNFLPENQSFATNTIGESTLLPSFVKVKVVFPGGVSREKLNNVAFPYVFYLDVAGRKRSRYTLLSDSVYDYTSSELKNLGVDKKARILVLENVESFKIPKEKLPLRKAYPRIINYLTGDIRFIAWFQARLAKSEYTQDSLIGSDIHTYHDYLEDSYSVEDVFSAEVALSMNELTWKFNEESATELLEDYNCTSVIDWNNMSDTNVNDLVDLFNQNGEMNVLYGGKYEDLKGQKYYITTDSTGDPIDKRAGNISFLYLKSGESKYYVAMNT